MTNIHIIGVSWISLPEDIKLFLNYHEKTNLTVSMFDNNKTRKLNPLLLSEEHSWRGGNRKKGNKRSYFRQ